MSPTPDSSRKPRAFPWACVPLSLLAMAVLYVATWPFVEIKCTDYKVVSLAKGITVHRTPPAPWVTALYKPLHYLCYPDGKSASKKERNLLLDYWNWWQVRLWSPASAPSRAAPKPKPKP